MRALLLLVLVGCALTSKATPIEIRYFSPVPARTQDAAPTRHQGRVRLGSITASSYLHYRIAHRRSAVELELEDSLRWTEQPEEYVRRSVSDALFGGRGVEQIVSGDALTVTIEVTAFEHVERAGRHFGCVQLRYELDDDRRVVASDVITVEREATSADIALVVAAISDALHDASSQVAERVAARASESN